MPCSVPLGQKRRRRHDATITISMPGRRGMPFSRAGHLRAPAWHRKRNMTLSFELTSATRMDAPVRHRVPRARLEIPPHRPLYDADKAGTASFELNFCRKLRCPHSSTVLAPTEDWPQASGRLGILELPIVDFCFHMMPILLPQKPGEHMSGHEY